MTAARVVLALTFGAAVSQGAYWTMVWSLTTLGADPVTAVAAGVLVGIGNGFGAAVTALPKTRT